MLLKPNKIEPGSLKRWLQEAVALAGRNFHLWFAVMLIMTSVEVCISMTPISSLLSFVLGTFTVKLSQEIAVRTEHGQASLSQLWDMAKAAASDVLPEMERNKFAMCVLILMSATNLLTQGVTATTAPLSMHPSLVEILFGWDALQRASRLYTFGVIAAYNPSIGGILAYPLQRMHDLRFDQAFLLIEQGASQNMGAVFAMSMTVFLMGVVGLLVLPFMLPFVLVLGPAVSYVACREMFGPGGKMQTKEQTSNLKPAMES